MTPEKLDLKDAEKSGDLSVKELSVHSAEEKARSSGIKPVFLAKVHVLNDALAECGMGACGDLTIESEGRC